jgi:hypothetical protein
MKSGKIDISKIAGVLDVPRQDHNTKNIFYQDGPNGPKGAVEFTADGRAIITAFESFDVSTGVHELAHVARRQLFDRGIPHENRKGITDAHISTAEKWCSVENGEWKRENEEKFALGFEKYIRDGVFPNERLRKNLDSAREFLFGIYKTLEGSAINFEITPEMRSVFDAVVSRGGGNGEASTKEAIPDTVEPLPIPYRHTTQGIYNAHIADMNRRYGFPDAEAQNVIKGHEIIWNQALEHINEKAKWDALYREEKQTTPAPEQKTGSDLVDDLNRTGRTPSPVEVALLSHEAMKRRNAVDAALRAFNELPQDASKERRDNALHDINRANADAIQIRILLRGVGCEQALAFNARKMLFSNVMESNYISYRRKDARIKLFHASLWFAAALWLGYKMGNPLDGLPLIWRGQITKGTYVNTEEVAGGEQDVTTYIYSYYVRGVEFRTDYDIGGLHDCEKIKYLPENPGIGLVDGSGWHSADQQVIRHFLLKSAIPGILIVIGFVVGRNAFRELRDLSS